MKNKLLPVPEGLRVHITHVHDAKYLRVVYGKNPPKYVTFADLYGRESLLPLARAESLCSPKDQPSRKLGRIIAHNRVVADYLKNNSRQLEVA